MDGSAATMNVCVPCTSLVAADSLLLDRDGEIARRGAAPAREPDVSNDALLNKNVGIFSSETVFVGMALLAQLQRLTKLKNSQLFLPTQRYS